MWGWESLSGLTKLVTLVGTLSPFFVRGVPCCRMAVRADHVVRRCGQGMWREGWHTRVGLPWWVDAPVVFEHCPPS